MTRFLQLHLLTVYPPANLNRDDTGRPKTAQFGGHTRLRVSSQSLKRAWRTSEAFEAALAGHLGKRTQRLGELVLEHLRSKGIEESKQQEIALHVARIFGKLETDKKRNPLFIKQLAFASQEELASAFEIAERLAAGEKLFKEFKADDDEANADFDNQAGGNKQKKKEKRIPGDLVLRTTDTAVDIAMFGRMLADDPDFNREAAVQVAHAITTHRVVVEDDYYTAVDDLKRPSEDAGAGFIGEAGFGSGVFYIYMCIDQGLLERNLGGDQALACRGIAALIKAAATVAPKGKQASFASRAKASYVLAEYGDMAPRTLATAFLKPIKGERDGMLVESIAALQAQRRAIVKAYGEELETCQMICAPDVPEELRHEGTVSTLDDVIKFATEGGIFTLERT